MSRLSSFSFLFSLRDTGGGVVVEVEAAIGRRPAPLARSEKGGRLWSRHGTSTCSSPSLTALLLFFFSLDFLGLHFVMPLPISPILFLGAVGPATNDDGPP